MLAQFLLVRGVILVCGALTWAAALVLDFMQQETISSAIGELPGSLPSIVIEALVWVALFEAISRVAFPRNLKAAAIILPVTVLLGTALGGILYWAYDTTVGTAGDLDVAAWYAYLTVFPENAIIVGRAAILVGLIFAFGSPEGMSMLASIPAASGAVRTFETMTKPHQLTRLLCASAYLAGSQYRDQVLNACRQSGGAVAPEIDIDVRLVMQTCLKAQDRQWGFVGAATVIAIVTAIFANIEADVGVVLGALAAICLYYGKVLGERNRLLVPFRHDTFNIANLARDSNVPLEPRLERALPRPGQNLVVYKGFVPFVGAGIELGRWSFATLVDQPAGDWGNKAPTTFTVEELYSGLDAALSGLNLPNVECLDYYFVAGMDISGDKAILSDPYGVPTQILPPEVAKDYIARGDERIRHYKWIRVTDWGGELVVSHFLRCALRGRSLFVEMNRYLLPPLADQYQKVDSTPPVRGRAYLGLLLESMFAGPIFCAVAPFMAFAGIQGAINRAFHDEERARRKQIDSNPLFDYGAATSLRQSLSGRSFARYFQKTDADFYGKTIERRILSEIVRFLESHNIDTTDIRERQTTILNSGIMVQGGDVNAESLAVGEGARATKSTRTGRAQRKAAS